MSETKRLDRLFKKLPPKSPLNSLEAIVKDWKLRFVNGPEAFRRDGVIEYCSKSKNFSEAIKRACASRNEKGKMYSHQSKVKEKDREHFAFLIKKYWIDDLKDFDNIHDLLEEIAPYGIGPVTIYDVSVRISAYLKLEPKSLYLHAGVRIGWNALHGRRSPSVKRILRKDLPGPLRKLPTDEVEDLLCTYRAYLKPWYKNAS